MIRLGPEGWRGVIAEEITVASVRRVASAIARVLANSSRGRRGVLIGFDTRFLSERFAREAAAAVAAHGVPAHLSPAPVPTPALAFAVRAGKRAGGIIVTAGDGPAEHSGLRLCVADGGAARPEILRAIEGLANEPGPGTAPGAASRSRARRGVPRASRARPPDLRADYLKQIGRLVRLRAVRRAGLDVACDPRRGAAIGYLDAMLARACRTVETIHAAAHPAFENGGPDCGERNLRPLARLVRRRRLALGLATDGEGGRFGIIDSGGHFIPPNPFLALLADYLIERRGLEGGVARTVATTHLIDAVCAQHGRTVYETPLGFESLGGLLASGRAFLACEESGGLGLHGHVPERDGILAGLLATEMVAARRRSLRDQVRDLFARIGPVHGRRIDYHTDPGTRERLLRRLEEIPAVFAGKRTARCDTTDGSKRIFADGSWILFRVPAGDPVIRCYIEARTTKDVEALTAAARLLITGS